MRKRWNCNVEESSGRGCEDGKGMQMPFDMKRLGAAWRATLLASLIGTAVTYVMFAWWLRVPLPPGLLNGIVS